MFENTKENRENKTENKIKFSRTVLSKKGRSSVFIKYKNRKIGEIFRMTPLSDWYVYLSPDLIKQYSCRSLVEIRKEILDWEKQIIDFWIRQGRPGFKKND